jgi:hypothetical protein
MKIPHAVLASNWRKPKPRNFRRFLLGAPTTFVPPPMSTNDRTLVFGRAKIGIATIMALAELRATDGLR